MGSDGQADGRASRPRLSRPVEASPTGLVRGLPSRPGPGADGKKVRFQVKVDGAAPGADHGSDIDVAR